jgi:hypothetical protein
MIEWDARSGSGIETIGSGKQRSSHTGEKVVHRSVEGSLAPVEHNLGPGKGHCSFFGFLMTVMARLIGGDNPPVVSLVAARDDNTSRSHHVLF